MEPNIDFNKAFDLVESTKGTIEYRDGLLGSFADVSRVTDAQRKVWAMLDRWEGKKDEHGNWVSQLAAIVGAKGSGKTHTGAAFACRKMQKYPNSMGCVVSNTYGQVKDNAIPAFEKMTRMLGLNAEFYNTVKIDGRPYTKVYIMDLGGGKRSYMLVRSLDAVHLLEGVELDWLWVEEIQHAPKSAFVTAFSRVRGQNSDRSVFIAGMSDSTFHWMYKFLPAAGFIEESNFDPAKHRGILLEPSLYENVQNVGQDYIDRLMVAYDAYEADMYVHGKRVSLGGNKVLPAYQDSIHRTGTRSRLLSKYDNSRELYISIDFNISPMTATVWQMMPWNDAWDGPGFFATEKGELARFSEDNRDIIIVDPYEIAKPNTELLTQVDEFEVWPDGIMGGTELLMQRIWEKYADHIAGITILGDATGNRGDTRSHTTDWNLIADSVQQFAVKKVEIIRGLESTFNVKTGEVKYSNPPRRDTINRLNGYLRNAKEEIRMCFMPESPLQSGGAARSCAMLTYKPDGTVDETVDRQVDRDQYRTHPFDTVRYMVWYISGGSAMAPENFEAEMDGLHTDEAPRNRFFV